MGLEEFRIIFGNPHKTYYSGETVTGNVFLVLNSPKKIRGIRVRIKGEAHTSWTVRINQHLTRYLGHEEYFSTRYYIAGSESGELELSAGNHEFTFEYALPKDLPSSFESDVGHVRYSIKSTIDRPWKYDHETKDVFKVRFNYDLNTDPRAKQSVTVEESKSFGLFFASPPLTVNFSLPVIGYVPGQSIPIKVNIENESGIPVNSVRITLNKYVTYRQEKSGPDFKTVKTKITEVVNQLEDKDTVSYEQMLKIPPLQNSNLINCGIIDITYILKLKAFVNKLSSADLKMATPILIGTVPLHN
ncbi:arrestin domain-containing protein 17-like [Belonocnema kinseyi]|uniref:arrestin domain-containing protein 17-like n=1 Tax=Belonocnema kinseyi TaxID=2817044 RepID=UPI00143D4AF2|nr:arrestin domain-containing protein 17-like [Belonocnema kinseyi]